ncbi:MAG TPA: hypothetical protein VGD78_20570 [Chthoniobacterales bacterium]
MRNLNKPISRQGTASFLHTGKRIFVTLEPGDVLAMRLEGEPTTHRAPLAKVFVQLCLWSASTGHNEPEG